MTDLNIQYTTTDDGAGIAYAAVGRGYTVVRMSAIVGSFLTYWRDPVFGAIGRRTSDYYEVVQYDGRGWGLSQRDAADFSMEARLKDLDAVVRATGRRRLALYGDEWSVPVGVAYAVQNPGTVRHLILDGGFARAADVAPWAQLKPLVELCRTNWGLGSKILADVAHPTRAADDTTAQRLRNIFKECISGESMAEWFAEAYKMDVTDLLPQLRIPTLIFHRRGDQVVRFALGQELAARVPNARFIPLEGMDAAPSAEQFQEQLQVIHSFLRPRSRGRSPLAASVSRAETSTILFTDVEGSTALTDQMGDAEARQLLRQHERITRQALKAHGGSEVKAMGDGFMASFGSATKALECAAAIQGNMAATEVRVRIGLNAGEPIAEDDDLFGTAVIVAARIAAQAQGGEILVSDVVRQLVAGKGFLFSDRGNHALKGFEEPVRVYEVNWRNA